MGARTKSDAKGEIGRFYSRLVACGNEQVFSVDYGLTFAVLMEFSTVKVILVLFLRKGFQQNTMTYLTPT